MFEGDVGWFCSVRWSRRLNPLRSRHRRRVVLRSVWALPVSSLRHRIFGAVLFPCATSKIGTIFSKKTSSLYRFVCQDVYIFFHTSIQSASARSYQTWNKTSEMETSRSRWSARNPPAISRSPERCPNLNPNRETTKHPICKGWKKSSHCNHHFFWFVDLPQM